MSRKIIIAFSGWDKEENNTCASIVRNTLTSQFEYGMNIGSLKTVLFDTKFENPSHIEELIKGAFGINPSEADFDPNAPIKGTEYVFREQKSYNEVFSMLEHTPVRTSYLWMRIIRKNLVREFMDSSEKESTGDTVRIMPNVSYYSEIDMLKSLKKFRQKKIEIYHYCILSKNTLPEWVKLDLDPRNETELGIIKSDFKSKKSDYEWYASNPKMTDCIINDGTHEDLEHEIMNKVIKKIWK